MRWVPVESRAFRAAAYGKNEHFLHLRFRSGEVYRYLDVPVKLYQEFLAADSKGRYFRESILESKFSVLFRQ
jgi:hypothetical protein